MQKPIVMLLSAVLLAGTALTAAAQQPMSGGPSKAPGALEGAIKMAPGQAKKQESNTTPQQAQAPSTTSAMGTGGSVAAAPSGPASASSLGTAATTAPNTAGLPTGSATAGSGGSAAAGTTSASTLGMGGVSATPTERSAVIGSGGSAAAVGGKVDSRTRLNANQNNMNAKSQASAKEQGGTWSRSKTQTKVHKGEVTSRTKSMSHLPGGAPTKSTTTQSSQLPSGN